MTAQPDPQQVREIAREYLADRISEPSDVGAYVMGHLGPLGDDLTKHEYGAWCSAVRADLRAAVPLWPDEQPQAERDEGLAFQAEHAIELLAALTDPDPCHYDHHGGCQAHGFLELKSGEKCPHSLARAFLAGAGPTRTTWQAERDDDVRVVAALLAARADGASMAECKHAFDELRDRFAERIAALAALALAALDARKGGEAS